ncbi:MAG: NAD(+) synthase [Treponema sp.]|nr:NAD(+) synthase [Treponema sp.]
MFNAFKIKNEIINWIQNYFENNGKNCNAIVGISGGKDSSVVTALCARALGAERVIGVLMPQGEQHDIQYSKELVDFLGIKHKIINIKETVNSLLSEINKSGMTANRQAVINTPARIRMTVLYAVSAAENGRVANTCNLSEDFVGYSTKYGDSAGDFSPLSSLTVAEVKLIGRELNLPEKFINKTPEDGLSGFSDEENLGFTYDTLDKYIREGICEDAAVKEKINRLHNLNKHKIELIPSYKIIN